MKSFARLLLMGFFLASPGLAVAQIPFPGMADSPAEPPPPLSAGVVEKVVSSYQAILVEFKDYQPGESGSELMNYLQERNAVAKAEKIMQKYGFKNWAEWSVGFSQTMMAFAAYKAREVRTDYEPELRKQLAEIESNPNISEEQKQQVLAMMKVTQTFMNAFGNVSEQDIKTVAPYAARLEAMLKEQDK